MPRQRHRTQSLRAGRPAGPKEPEQGRAETASYRGGTSRGDSSALFPLPVSYEAITRRLNSCYNGLRQWYRSPIANLNRAPQKARSARPPHFRSKDARGLQRRRLYAYKLAVRLKRPKKAATAHPPPEVYKKATHRAHTPQKHTSKHPYPPTVPGRHRAAAARPAVWEDQAPRSSVSWAAAARRPASARPAGSPRT